MFVFVNDLLSVLYALFSGYVSVGCDVGVRSTVSYSVSPSFPFAHPSSLFSPSFPEYSHQHTELFTALPLLFSRERNVRKHSKPGTVPVVSEKEKHVVTVVK